eukprot:1378852-Heterocapsa_arctica.AAC.1
MEVWGCSPSELRKLQTRAGACMSPFTKGASLSTKLLIHGDPTASLAVSALHRYAKEVWAAGTNPGVFGKSLPQLRQAWESALRTRKASGAS